MNWYHHVVRGAVQVGTIGLGILAGAMLVNYFLADAPYGDPASTAPATAAGFGAFTS